MLVEAEIGNSWTNTYPATGNTTHLVVEDLMEDTLYSLYVVATNQFGEGNKSATLEIGKATGYGIVIRELDVVLKGSQPCMLSYNRRLQEFSCLDCRS